MGALIKYPSIAGTQQIFFVYIKPGMSWPWGTRVLVSAPKQFQFSCPVKRIAGPPAPLCTQEHDHLDGCNGLPLPGEFAFDRTIAAWYKVGDGCCHATTYLYDNLSP